MDPIEKQERKREAQRRLRSQRRRAGLLRSRVIVISLVAFALLWGTVFVQMATGNDPVLGDSSRTVSVSQRTATAHGRNRAAASPTETDPATDSVETVEPEPEPAPVVTSQS
jgi:cytoskeletal protein RodZ